MALLRLVPYGPPAARALRDAIVQAKRGDPLAPVTVAVPSNYAGLSLRRSLGIGDLSLAAVSGQQGLVNVRFLVLARIAELLGAPHLSSQGRRPLTNAVRAEAIRAALAANPGVFSGVENHAATERSLDESFRDLRSASQQTLDAIARQSERAAQVVRLFRDTRQRTAAYYDEEELTLAAAEAVRAGSPALRDVGHVILHLPRHLSAAERSLSEALANADRLSALFGHTGDPDSDSAARKLAEQLEAVLGPAEEESLTPAPMGTQIVSTPDAEEEIRSVIRLVMERLADGTPLHRMAVLYRAAQPYALLAYEQFRAAGITYNGPAVRSLAQTLTGRTLLGILRLREQEFRRDAVMDWLSSAPVLEEPGGRPLPAYRWGALSRSAGVVVGAAQWRERLAQYQRSLNAQRSALVAADEPGGRLQRIEADLKHTERLAQFMSELTSQVAPGARSSWAEFGAWAKGLLERYLGGTGHQRDWPDDEIEAHRAVEETLGALSNLGDVRPRTDEATFRRALERELETAAGRIGRFGDGVFIGRLSDAAGADFEVVFLLGVTEGLLPTRVRDDPLLPDRERAVGDADLPLRVDRLAEERRAYLAALAAAPERVLLFPRADLRGQRRRLPSRWLLESASSLEGRTIFGADLETLPSRPWFTVVPSFESALASQREPASEQEYDLRSLLHARLSGLPITEHYLVTGSPALLAGLSADMARHGQQLSRWDGYVQEATELAPSADRPVSPTALQNWAACPFRYFLGHVLYVSETEHPEETLTLSALERGNLIHNALETFISEQPPRTTPTQPWSDDERARLARIGEQLCAEAEAAGVTGKPLLWKLERSRILRDLAGFLDEDEALRAEHGVVPAAVELAFGVRGAEQPPLVTSLDDGRSIAFRGRIDRVDRSPDGSRLLVLDYKSGSAQWYRQLDKDPLKRGRLLQLPVYALAAQQRYGDAPVRASYWFVNEQANYDLAGYDVTEEKLQQFRDTLSVIVGGIGRGLFPARPGERRNEGFENCQLCPYDRLCLSDRARIWERKRLVPELRDYVDLAEPDE